MASKKNNGAAKTAGHETTVRQCQVKLTEAERVNRGDEMADCEVKIETLKSEASELARQVKSHAKRRNELGHALEAGTELRDLKCTWVPDFAKNVFRLTRPDDGTVIDTRPMSAADRQNDMFEPGDAHNLHLAPPPRSPRGRKPKVARTPSQGPDAPAAA